MQPEKKSSLTFFVPVIILLILVFVIWRTITMTTHQGSPVAPINEPMPDFNLPSLFDREKRITSAELHGHVSLVNVWASWCSACRYEHSVLMKIKQNYHIPIYGVVYNDEITNALAWLNKHGNPYTAVAIDSQQKLVTDLKLEGIPATYIIDGNGIIRYRQLGVITEEVWMNDLLPIVKAYETQ